MNISIEQPLWFLLIPIVFAFFGITIARKKRVAKSKKIRFVITRLLVSLTLILALCGIGIHRYQKKTATIFLMDVSDSVMNASDQSKEFLQNAIKEVPEDEQFGIIAFGKNTKVEQFVTDRKVFNQLQTTRDCPKVCVNLQTDVR